MGIQTKTVNRMLAVAVMTMALALMCCLGMATAAEAAQARSTSITTQAVSKPTINLKSLSMQVGKTAKLKTTGGKGKTVWKSANKKVATVTKTGKVKAKRAGTTTITAAKSGKKLTCAVTVAKKSSKTLVVYFSHTGTTQAAAAKVKAATGADLVRIYPKKAYTNNYGKLTKLAQEEYRTQALPTRATKVLNMNQYSTVYVGFPVWWDNMPRLVQAFLADYNLKGKTVIPFCTSGSSGIDGSVKAARDAAQGANVLSGRDLTDDSAEQVKKWVAELKTGA